jgi:hypothetical protein
MVIFHMWFCAAAAFKTIPHHHCFLLIGCGIGQRVHFHEIFKNFTGAACSYTNGLPWFWGWFLNSNGIVERECSISDLVLLYIEV